MNCDWQKHSTDNEGRHVWQCARCYFKTAPTVRGPDRIHAPECRAIPRYWELGGWLELAFEIATIDKRRYLWLKHHLGLAPKCGCQQRISVLNALGEQVKKAILALFAKIGKLTQKR